MKAKLKIEETSAGSASTRCLQSRDMWIGTVSGGD